MATFSLREFIATVKTKDLARPNRFEVEITTPAVLSSYRETARILNLFCESSSFPTQNINTKAHRIYGPAYLRPVGAEYGGEGMQMVFYVDQQMDIKAYFDSWMFSIVEPNTYNVSYQREYTTQIKIKQLNNQFNDTYSVILYEAFPRSVNLLDLNASSNNVPHKLGVTFSYRYWKPIHNLTQKYNNVPPIGSQPTEVQTLTGTDPRNGRGYTGTTIVQTLTGSDPRNYRTYSEK